MEPNQYLADRFGNTRSPIMIPGTRWDVLPEIFRDLGYKVGAEIGVELGRYARCLVRKVPGLKLYGIDPWMTYEDQFNLHNPDKFYEKCVRDCAPYNIELIRKTSADAVGDFEDNSLDFVYIDGNHNFEYVVEDIAKWNKKVKVGGIISGHDYMFERRMGATAGYAVRVWTDIKYIEPWYVIGQYRKDGQIRENAGEGRPSWLFIKTEERNEANL